jgi:hypothetical protein
MTDSITRIAWRWAVTVVFSLSSVLILLVVGPFVEEAAWRIPFRDGTIFVLGVSLVVLPLSALQIDTRSAGSEALRPPEALAPVGYLLLVVFVALYATLWTLRLNEGSVEPRLVQLFSYGCLVAATGYGFACELSRSKFRTIHGRGA